MSNLSLKEHTDALLLDNEQDTFKVNIEDNCFVRCVPFNSHAGEGIDVRKYFKNKRQEEFFPSQKGIYLTIEQWKELVVGICRLVNFYPERPK